MTPGRTPLNRLALAILRRWVPAAWRDSIEGDLAESRISRRAAGRYAGGWWALRFAMVTSARLRCAGGRRLERTDVPLSRGGQLDNVRTDLRDVWRSLRGHRGYAAAAIVTLTIGIGANASVFSVANWLLLRQVPGVRHADRLVSLTLAAPGGGATGVSVPEWQALNTEVGGLASVAGYFDFQLHAATPGGNARRLAASLVTGNFFDVLDGPLAEGRGFTTDEGLNPGAGPTVVVSHRYWITDLGAAPDVVGRSMVINGSTFTVIGVTVPGFHGTSRTSRIDIWVPVGQHRRALPAYGRDVLTSHRRSMFFGLVGRLRDGVALRSIEAEVNALRAARADAGLAGRHPDWRFSVRAGTEPMPWVVERLSTTMRLLLGAVVLLLALTCANVGALMLARATERHAEMTTRLALGASRLRLARLLLFESLVLSAVASLLSVALAWGLGHWVEGLVIVPGMPPLAPVGLDWTVLGFAAALSSLVAVAAGLIPVLGLRRAASSSAFADASRTQSGRAGCGRPLLTVAQVAVSMTLVVGALLLVRSMHARLSLDPGFNPSRVLTLSLEPGMQGHPPARTELFFRQVLTRVREVPGVGSAGLAWLQPFSQGRSDTSLRAEGAPPETAVSADHNAVSSGFLGALGIQLVDGRDFSDAELFRRDPVGGVVILNASLARRLFGTTLAAGRRVTLDGPETLTHTVVGVIPDVRPGSLTSDRPDLVLEPFGQPFPVGYGAVQVGLTGPVHDVLPRITEVIRELDPMLPIYQAQTLEQAMRETVADDLLLARTVTVFAALAISVAMVGLAALLARRVVERRRELSIRVALGATPSAIAARVTRDALVLASAGAASGLMASWWLTRFISSRLFGVSSGDPVIWLSAAALVMVCALLASVWPARAAARVDPASVLR